MTTFNLNIVPIVKPKIILRIIPFPSHLDEDQRIKFHCCYLLQSISNPRKTYIGYTVNPFKRLRQHNGEIKGGAKKTRRGRPWRLICYVVGFVNENEALKFEWRWQHPTKGLKHLIKKKKNPFIKGGYCELKGGRSLKGCLRCLAQTANLKKWTKSAINSLEYPLTVYWKIPPIDIPINTPNMRWVNLS